MGIQQAQDRRHARYQVRLSRCIELPRKPPPRIRADDDLEGFSQIPEALLPLMHEHLNKSEMLVLLALLRWQVGVNRYSRPASDIARTVGMSDVSVRKALSGLVGKGFLRKVAGGYRSRTAVFSLAVRGKSVTDWLPKTKGESVPVHPDENASEPT